MSTTAVTSTPATSPAAAASTATNPNTLGKTDFMNLLVTQLQNQDPTQPQDGTAFIAQLATFSSLEQLQNMNQTLTSIATFFNSVPSTASSTAAASTTNTTGTANATGGN
jgi:flagellar basal-body rod modification protein FlgD